jgi:hypothetical protein
MSRKILPHKTEDLSASEDALANALDGLEDTRMTPSDDPALSKLKADIRRSITKPKKNWPRPGKKA